MTREAVYKQLSRAKEKLRTEKVKIELPGNREIAGRLENSVNDFVPAVQRRYYSTSQNTILRKDLCLEAIRLNLMLLENETDKHTGGKCIAGADVFSLLPF